MGKIIWLFLNTILPILHGESYRGKGPVMSSSRRKFAGADSSSGDQTQSREPFGGKGPWLKENDWMNEEKVYSDFALRNLMKVSKLKKKRLFKNSTALELVYLESWKTLEGKDMRFR